MNGYLIGISRRLALVSLELEYAAPGLYSDRKQAISSFI